MKTLLAVLLVMTSSVVCAQTLPEVNSFSQQKFLVTGCKTVAFVK